MTGIVRDEPTGVLIDVPQPFSDLPPRAPFGEDDEIDDPPLRPKAPDDPEREGLWTIVRRYQDDGVTIYSIRILDCPNPGVH